MRFTGKTAVITGAARGIGKEIAVQLAEEGAAVVLVDIRHADEIARKLQDSGAKALALHIDITDYDAVRHAVDEIVAWNNGIDILVNNAGIIARGNITELTVETWLKVMDVNLNGTFYLCKAILPFIIEKRYGRIVNVTSIAAKTGDITAAAAYGT
ncbi:MAG: SDR family NAD(P)-dependent oxidoreductase, partial [Spirochaetales bacterium]|nr:SDR family NAD(P)-dependent oxidoreductase [Spirochaetales bacterium]